MTSPPAWFLLLLTLACAGEAGRDGPEATESDPAPPSAADSALQRSAERVMAFLRDSAAYESLGLADTVELLVPEEGGGGRRRVARDALRDRAAWFVESSGQRYAFVPPPELTVLTAVPGVHFNCREGRLAERVPELAALPHVGVRLMPAAAESCLQVWNATFVFDTAAGRQLLVAAIRDQWEW